MTTHRTRAAHAVGFALGLCMVTGTHAQIAPTQATTSAAERYPLKGPRFGFVGPTGEPERIQLVRGQPAIVQTLVMGPEATQLWRQLQTLIEQPELIKDFPRLVALMEISTQLPMDAVDWKKRERQNREDLRFKHHWLVESARYGVSSLYPAATYPKRRDLEFDMRFNIQNICLSKQEVQRLYSTGWETGEVHSSDLWDNKIGARHGSIVHAKDSGYGGAFSFSASGCAISFGIIKNLEIITEENKK